MKPFVIIIILFWMVIGCESSKRAEELEIQKEYGASNHLSDKLAVEIVPDRFKTWDDLIARTFLIACNDSIPRMTISTDNGVNIVYLNNPCWLKTIVEVDTKNIIEVHNDVVGKVNEKTSSLDSLDSFLKKDIENWGKNQNLSSSPDDIVFWVSYDENGSFKKLPNTLNRMIGSFERLTEKTIINIWLIEKLSFD